MGLWTRAPLRSRSPGPARLEAGTLTLVDDSLQKDSTECVGKCGGQTETRAPTSFG